MKKRFVTTIMSLVLLTTALGGTAQAAEIPATVIPATASVLEFQSTSAPEIRIAVEARVAKEKAEAEEKRKAEAKHRAKDPIYMAHPTLEQVLKTLPPRPEGYEICEEDCECGECLTELTEKDPTKCTCANWTYGWDPCLYKDKKCKHASGWMEGSYDVPIPGTCTAMSGVAFYCKDCWRLGWKGVAQNGPSECHWNITEKRKDRTCTQDGYCKCWCKTCGKVFDDSILLALGHSWQYELDEKWNRIKKCAKCGLTWQGSDEDFPVPEGAQLHMPQGEEDLLHDDADLIHGHDGKRKK